MSGEYANWQERQRQGRVVVWPVKSTERHQAKSCADQGELFTHAEAAQAARSGSGDEPAAPDIPAASELAEAREHGLTVRAPEFTDRISDGTSNALVQLSRFAEMTRSVAPIMAADWVLLFSFRK